MSNVHTRTVRNLPLSDSTFLVLKKGDGRRPRQLGRLYERRFWRWSLALILTETTKERSERFLLYIYIA